MKQIDQQYQLLKSADFSVGESGKLIVKLEGRSGKIICIRYSNARGLHHPCAVKDGEMQCLRNGKFGLEVTPH